MSTLGKRVWGQTHRGFESLPVRQPFPNPLKVWNLQRFTGYDEGMSSHTVTPDQNLPMPRNQGLLLRGSRWYSNLKVPVDLREAFGKQHIRESLGTSDYREACRVISYEKARWMACFDSERKKLSRHSQTPARGETRLLTCVSQREAFEIATRYLVTQEGKMRDWMAKDGRFLDSDEREEVRSNIDYDASYFASTDYEPIQDGTEELGEFLASEGILCPKTSPAFRALRPLIFEAHVESLKRSQDIVCRMPAREHNPLFRGVNLSSTPPDSVEGFTVNDLIGNKEKANRDLKRSPKTAMAFQHGARLLRESLGGNKLLSSISRTDMDGVFDLMQSIPLNATQRYKGLTLAQAIQAAKGKGDTCKPAQNTNWATYTQILAAFRMALEDGLMTENPAANRRYREMFKKERCEPRVQFTIPELNKLFRAPLYTGCENDESGYARRGKNSPRRGRFWVPLLALFHGMRNNEACQIYTEDVKTNGAVEYIAIREALEDSQESEKKLKTQQSEREVPIHPELIQMGFLDFVAERRNDKNSPRLFPELTSGHNGYFSDAFSKWFTRFVKGTLGEQCEATLHSFRHQFRDATRVARLPDESVGRLAGWEHGKGQSRLLMHQYGGGVEYLRILAKDLAKIKYPQLDLSHLYSETQTAPIARQPRLRE